MWQKSKVIVATFDIYKKCNDNLNVLPIQYKKHKFMDIITQNML